MFIENIVQHATTKIVPTVSSLALLAHSVVVRFPRRETDRHSSLPQSVGSAKRIGKPAC